MIHTIDRDRRFGGRSQRINTPSSMRKAEDYIKQEIVINKETGEIIEKTNRALWYSSTGIVDDFARQCMTLQKQQGYTFKQGDKRLMVHQIQSFDVRDNEKNSGKLTPELAHKIGVALAEKMYANYQVLVVTHYNTKHIHNHILINGVANPVQNKDGTFQKPHKFQDGNNAYKYENEFALKDVKAMDEKLCLEYGLTYSSNCYSNKKEKRNSDLTTDSKNIKTPILDNYKKWIDKAISMCQHFDIKEFRKILNKSFGITVKIDNSRNSITYKSKTEEKIKKVSGTKLGNGYRLEDIHERLRSLKATADTTERERNANGNSSDSTTEDIRAELENRRTESAAERTEYRKQESVGREENANQSEGRNAGRTRKV